jgi:predicted dehydrogenase
LAQTGAQMEGGCVIGSYKAVIVGLTGIGGARPSESIDPVYGNMPNSHASAYHRHPKTEVVAVCDVKQEMLEAFYTRWKDVWPNVKTYTHYQDMLDKEQPDLVSVVTPDHYHREVTIAAVESSARAILCEKPIATTLDDADAMIAAAKKHNVLLSIEHSRRWYPSYLQARALIQSGEIGPLRTIVCEMFSSRAMMFRNGTHLIDMVCFFAGGTPSWVMADLEDGFEHFTEYNGNGKDPATDPYASAYVRFDNGVRSFVNFYKTEFPGHKISLTCENGRIEISDQKCELLTPLPASRWWSQATLVPDQFMYTKQSGAVAELVDVLENGGTLISPPEEARKTLQIMLGIMKSHHGGNVRVNL